EFPREVGHRVASGGEGLGAGVQCETADPVRAHEPAHAVGGFEDRDLLPRPGCGAGGHEAGHSAADDGEIDALGGGHWSCAQATRRVRTSGSVVGGTPWPRLSTWAGAAWPAASTVSVCSCRAGQPALSSAGSILPCRGTPGSAAAASSKG